MEGGRPQGIRGISAQSGKIFEWSTTALLVKASAVARRPPVRCAGRLPLSSLRVTVASCIAGSSRTTGSVGLPSATRSLRVGGSERAAIRLRSTPRC